MKRISPILLVALLILASSCSRKSMQLQVMRPADVTVEKNEPENLIEKDLSTKIVIEEDGIYKELLEQQFISDIKVDGSNNKWVGTIGSGLFYFSQNGQQTIYHFTKNNSPLPSNNINKLLEHDHEKKVNE